MVVQLLLNKGTPSSHGCVGWLVLYAARRACAPRLRSSRQEQREREEREDAKRKQEDPSARNKSTTYNTERIPPPGSIGSTGNGRRAGCCSAAQTDWQTNWWWSGCAVVTLTGAGTYFEDAAEDAASHLLLPLQL